MDENQFVEEEFFSEGDGDDHEDQGSYDKGSYASQSYYSDEEGSARSFEEEEVIDEVSYYSDERSSRGSADESYRSGEEGSRSLGEEGSFRSGDSQSNVEDSYRSGDSRSYRSGDSRSYRSGDSRSYRSGDSRSYRSGDSRSYRSGDSRSYRSGDSRSYRSGDSRSYRSGDSRSYRSGDSRSHPSEVEDSFVNDEQSFHEESFREEPDGEASFREDSLHDEGDGDSVSVESHSVRQGDSSLQSFDKGSYASGENTAENSIRDSKSSEARSASRSHSIREDEEEKSSYDDDDEPDDSLVQTGAASLASGEGTFATFDSPRTMEENTLSGRLRIGGASITSGEGTFATFDEPAFEEAEIDGEEPDNSVASGDGTFATFDSPRTFDDVAKFQNGDKSNLLPQLNMEEGSGEFSKTRSEVESEGPSVTDGDELSEPKAAFSSPRIDESAPNDKVASADFEGDFEGGFEQSSFSETKQASGSGDFADGFQAEAFDNVAFDGDGFGSSAFGESDPFPNDGFADAPGDDVNHRSSIQSNAVEAFADADFGDTGFQADEEAFADPGGFDDAFGTFDTDDAHAGFGSVSSNADRSDGRGSPALGGNTFHAEQQEGFNDKLVAVDGGQSTVNNDELGDEAFEEPGSSSKKGDFTPEESPVADSRVKSISTEASPQPSGSSPRSAASHADGDQFSAFGGSAAVGNGSHSSRRSEPAQGIDFDASEGSQGSFDQSAPERELQNSSRSRKSSSSKSMSESQSYLSRSRNSSASDRLSQRSRSVSSRSRSESQSYLSRSQSSRRRGSDRTSYSASDDERSQSLRSEGGGSYSRSTHATESEQSEGYHASQRSRQSVSQASEESIGLGEVFGREDVSFEGQEDAGQSQGAAEHSKNASEHPQNEISTHSSEQGGHDVRGGASEADAYANSMGLEPAATLHSGDSSMHSRSRREAGTSFSKSDQDDEESFAASELVDMKSPKPLEEDSHSKTSSFASKGAVSKTSSIGTGLYGDQITVEDSTLVSKSSTARRSEESVKGDVNSARDADSLAYTASTNAASIAQKEKASKTPKHSGDSSRIKKSRKRRKKRKDSRSQALIDLAANVEEAFLVMEDENRSETSESREKVSDTSAHNLLHGFEALMGVLLQLSDELELVSTFGLLKKKKDPSTLVQVNALKAVLSFAQTIDQLFAQLRPIIEDCFVEEPDEEMDDMLYRLNSLVDLLCETTHRVSEKQEWNERAETTYVTLLELMEHETVELVCYFDNVETPPYDLSANIHEAWSATGHIEELRALQLAGDPWLFRQLCYEVMVSTDQWCPDTGILMEICGIEPSLLEEDPIEQVEEEELAPIPQAAEHILDKVNGDPLPRQIVLSNILRRILPPRAVTDTALLDNFTSIRNTLRNPLGLSATNIVAITSMAESLDDPEALGVGGMGKSTLAAMVAVHPDVRNYFIDGVVWVYVGDKELNYSRYTQCLRELVAQLDFYEGVPLFAELLHTPGESLSKRRRREEGFMVYARDTIAELLHSRSVLIILDDVCFEPDLDWFDFAPMPGESTDDLDSTCALLVTTRCRTLLPAADTVEVEMLDEADAISLLIQESGQLSHTLLAESKEARAVVQECANHPLAVKSVGRWLNLKHATAGVVSSVEEIHSEVIKSMDKIITGGDHNGTDMMYEILSLSLSPAIKGEPTNIIKFCLAAFVVVFCAKEYISDFALTEPTPIIPMDMAELLFETLLELNENSLLREGSRFYAQKKEAAVLIPEALSALGVLKVITYSDFDEDDEPQDEQKFLQIMHYIHQEYGEYLCHEDPGLQDLTKDCERAWNKYLVEAYVSRDQEWDEDIDDASHSYALEMIVSHMIRGGMFKEAGEVLADKQFVRGRLLSLGRENATRRHIKDSEMLFTKLKEMRQIKGQAKLEPRVVLKQSYQAIGGLLAMEEDDESVEGARIRNVEVARAHYEIGASLAERRCWDAAIAHWETAQELLTSSLGTVEVVAGILYNIGVVYTEMNDYEKALDSLKQCLRIRGTIHGEEHILYAQTIQKIGDVFLAMSDYHEAMESYNWALDVMYSEPSHHRVEIGEILDNKGNIHYSKGEIDEALQCHQDALRSKQVDLGEDHPELASTYHQIGNCLSDQGNVEDAIVHFEEAIRLKELDPEGGPERDADVLTIEGVLHNLERNQEQGLECYEKALQILVTKAPHRKEKVASLLHLIGCVYLMSGEQKKAMKLFEESLQARRKVLGFVHLDVASTLFNMAFLHQTRNRLDKALKCLEEALKIRELRLPDSEKVAVTHEKIGTLARAIGKMKKAEIAFEEALRIRKLIHGEQHEAVATVLQELGDLMDDLGEYDYAMNYYIDALDIRRNQLGPDDIAVAETLYSMGFTLHNTDATDRALVCFDESLYIRRFQLGDDSREVGDTLNMMGFLKAKKGDLDDALTLLWDALRIRKLQEDHIKVSETLKNIGNVHREKQEFTLAVECYEECLRIRRKELGDNHEKVADALIAMGNVESDMDQKEEAMRSYQEALKIRTMVFGEQDESVAAVLQYMGTMEFRSGHHDKARDLLTEFVRIRRDNNTKNDGNYVNVLFMIGNIHKMQGNEDEARICWSEAYQVFTELGLAETNPQIAKVMNHLLKVELNEGDDDDKKKKSIGASMFGKVTSKLKKDKEKSSKGRSERVSKKKRARKGKGIQL